MSSSAFQENPAEIVVFDFDGTITTRDTFALFLRYYAGTTLWALKVLRLLPVFALYGIRVIDRNAVKAHVIRTFFKNQPIGKVVSKAETFAKHVIPALVRPQAKEEIQRHLIETPESLYICSASINPYLDVWAREIGIKHVLATELEVRDGICTGHIKGWNVWGPGKVKRINAEFPGRPVIIREAYGDTRGDRELLHAAQKIHWKPFRVSEQDD